MIFTHGVQSRSVPNFFLMLLNAHLVRRISSYTIDCLGAGVHMSLVVFQVHHFPSKYCRGFSKFRCFKVTWEELYKSVVHVFVKFYAIRLWGHIFGKIYLALERYIVPPMVGKDSDTDNNILLELDFSLTYIYCAIGSELPYINIPAYVYIHQTDRLSVEIIFALQNMNQTTNY